MVAENHADVELAVEVLIAMKLPFDDVQLYTCLLQFIYVD